MISSLYVYFGDGIVFQVEQIIAEYTYCLYFQEKVVS